ncbi:MAG: hypothetical protein AAF735_08140 [Myxococcota bacterium]
MHTFQLGENHEVLLAEWNGEVHPVTYWSAVPNPELDLVCVANRYSDGHKWDVLTEGYLYKRSDGSMRMWCSAAPAIGVGTAEYLDSANGDSREQR